MGRTSTSRIRILAPIAVLMLVQGCQEHEQLKKEAPALARADLRVERIAIAGVVSDAPTIADTPQGREHWSLMMGNHFSRDRFGKLPIVSFNEVRAILGEHDYGVMLDRYQDEGGCDPVILADLRTLLDGKARFLVFANIVEDEIYHSDSEKEEVDKETKKTTSKTKTMTTTRTTTVRLRFYDLSDQQLAWDHFTGGQVEAKKEHDMTDVVEHDPKEGFLGGLLTSMLNSTIKPDPKYPATPEFEKTLAYAFDNVGEYLKPSKKK